MKLQYSLLFALSLWTGSTVTSHAQGTIVFNNLDPTNGKIFFGGEPTAPLLNQDINFNLRAFGPGMVPLLDRSWLLSDGTAKGINVGPGLFADPSHSVFGLPGIAPGALVSVWIDAWAGLYPTIEDARVARAAVGGTEFPMTAGTAQAPPPSFQRMPDFNLVVVPEPRMITLMATGLALFFLNKVRKKE